MGIDENIKFCYNNSMQKELYFEKLEKIYKYFISQEFFSSYDIFFVAICKEFGFLEPVKAKTEQECQNDEKLFRGVGDDSKNMVNLVCETNADKIFIGSGVFGYGIYCTRKFETAMQYAFEQKKNVIRLSLEKCSVVDCWKISSLKRFIASEFNKSLKFSLHETEIEETDELMKQNENIRYLIEFLKGKTDENEVNKFLSYLLNNPSNLAAIVGYDAMDLTSRYKKYIHESILVLNRGKLGVNKRFHKKLSRQFLKSSERNDGLIESESENQPN